MENTMNCIFFHCGIFISPSGIKEFKRNYLFKKVALLCCRTLGDGTVKFANLSYFGI